MICAHFLHRPWRVTGAKVRLAVPWIVLVNLWIWPIPGQAQDNTAALAQLNQLLLEEQIDSAVESAQQLYAAQPEDPAVQVMAGSLKFYQGDYAGAVALLERGLGGPADLQTPPGDTMVKGPVRLLAQARQAAKIFANPKIYESEHFVLRSQAGRDSLLGLYALQGLESARAKLGPIFGFFPKRKVVVDILPDTLALAAISPLSEQAIKTSGTIALAKYGRLMVTSPRALMFGYDWQDTLAHEYIHLLITERTHNRVPVWLQEGLAKYFETTWRGTPGLALGPGSERLLARGVKNKKLISFSQMHPSMALLPSQEDTALAFAEVFTVIEFVVDKYKTSAIDALLAALTAGHGMESAFDQATGKPFSALLRDWKTYLRQRSYRQTPGSRAHKLVFKQRGDRDDIEVGTSEIKFPPRVEKRRRLGGILRSAGRPKAAAMQYRRALKRAGAKGSYLYNVVAATYIEAKQYPEALEVLQAARLASPDDPQTQILTGRVALILKQWKKARQAYLHANRVHPFHPEIHASLFEIAKQQGDDDSQAREVLALRALASESADGLERAQALPDDSQLSIETQPFARVIIDDRDQGLWTPLVDYALPAGSHSLHLQNPLYGVDEKFEIELAPGEHKKLQRSLNTTLQN